MKQLLGIFFLIMTLISCGPDNSDKKSFNLKELDKAWKQNNKKILSFWIESLKDEKLSDKDFFRRVAYLSSTTNMVFGNLEVDSIFWQNASLITRKTIRHNIAIAYSCYLESCLLFNKKITWADTEPLQERFYTSVRALSQEEIKQLMQHLNELCNKN